MENKSFAIVFVIAALYMSTSLLFYFGKLEYPVFFAVKYDTFELDFSKNGVNTSTSDTGKAFVLLGQSLEKTKDRNSTLPYKKTHYIFVYTTESWFSPKSINRHFSKCVNYCKLTTNKQYLRTADAVIFHFPYGKFNLRRPPISRKDRNENQPWIAMHLESPSNIDMTYLFTDEWNKVFNWSMSYRFDADIQIAYGALTLRNKEPNKNYSEIMLRKIKMAVWFVSNCNTKSKRDVLVQILQANGVDVDIYGRCGKGFLRQNDIIEEYKFYFAFENSLCEDYVTEKFFSRYNKNVILVTYGGADYNSLLPEGTFINAANFKNATHLANYLISLASDNQQYIRMLKAKDRFLSLENRNLIWSNSMCNLCNKINNVKENRRTYEGFYELLSQSQCKYPKTMKRGYKII